MKDLIIVGAGGFGREVLQWIKDVNKVSQTWNIIGFIDDNPHALDGYHCDYNILGCIRDWKVSNKEVYVCAVAVPSIKEKLIASLKTKGAIFATVIHPTSIIGDFCNLGEGVVVTPFAKISPNVIIGSYVTILGSGIGHDTNVGAFSTIAGNCSVNGCVIIGERVFIASNVCIAPSKKIGDDAFIGMGSMVVSNIKPNYKVMGNPAKRIVL